MSHKDQYSNQLILRGRVDQNSGLIFSFFIRGGNKKTIGKLTCLFSPVVIACFPPEMGNGHSGSELDVSTSASHLQRQRCMLPDAILLSLPMHILSKDLVLLQGAKRRVFNLLDCFDFSVLFEVPVAGMVTESSTLVYMIRFMLLIT